MSVKKCIITGISCQTGSYLAELLLEKGYKVYGLLHHNNLGSAIHLVNYIETLTVDLKDPIEINKICKLIKPIEFYNLAAQSNICASFKEPLLTMEITGEIVIKCLESIRLYSPETKFFQASSASIYGSVEGIINEDTSYGPKNPYALAKLWGHLAVKLYRQNYGIFACNGILFNHDSPRRNPNSLIKKIILGIKNIKSGKDTKLKLGNLDAIRGWGHAKDFVKGIYLILQQNTPDDYILANNETYTLGELCKMAFKIAGISDWQQYIELDPMYTSKTEIPILIGDNNKAKNILNWEISISTYDMIKEMIGDL